MEHDRHQRIRRLGSGEPVPSLQELMSDDDFYKQLGVPTDNQPGVPTVGPLQDHGRQVTHQNLDDVNALLEEHASAPRTASDRPSVSNAGIRTPKGTIIDKDEIGALDRAWQEKLQKNPKLDINAELTPFDVAIGRTEPGTRAHGSRDRLTSIAKAWAMQKVIDENWGTMQLQKSLAVARTTAKGIETASMHTVAADGTRTPNGMPVSQSKIADLERLREKFPPGDINAELTPYDRAIGRTEPGARPVGKKLPPVARALAVQKFNEGWKPNQVARLLLIGGKAASRLKLATNKANAKVNEHDAPQKAESSAMVAARNRGLAPRPPTGREGR